jgi:aspartyl/glutamyl-tRNA(Asn/Gln) amidotransferase C subunit
MKLTEEELKKLQKLACIKLSEWEKVKFWNQLESIINLLDELGKLDLSGDFELDEKDVNNLRTITWTEDFGDKNKLLQNVEHKLINNSVVIKSVLSE